MTWARILRPSLFVLGLACARDDGRGAAEVQPEPDVTMDASALDGGELSDAGLSEAASYRVVREIFNRSCSYDRCHAGVPIGGSLPLGAGTDLVAAMVDVPSCEYPPMVRVKPGDPSQSWLMVKLTAEVRPKDDEFYDYILFEPEPGWDPSQRGCRDQTPDGTPLFGQRMPLTAPNMLPEEELAAIADWIREGAPR